MFLRPNHVLLPWQKLLEKKAETGVELRGKTEEGERQRRAQERTGEATGKKESGGGETKRELDRDPLGKGTSLAPPGQGYARVRRAPSGCPRLALRWATSL